MPILSSKGNKLIILKNCNIFKEIIYEQNEGQNLIQIMLFGKSIFYFVAFYTTCFIQLERDRIKICNGIIFERTGYINFITT